jgi:hypothetical protein
MLSTGDFWTTFGQLSPSDLFIAGLHRQSIVKIILLHRMPSRKHDPSSALCQAYINGSEPTLTVHRSPRNMTRQWVNPLAGPPIEGKREHIQPEAPRLF